VVSPLPAEIDKISATYKKIVEDERASAQDFDDLRSIAHRLIESEQLDAIVLAGTDFSFVFGPENTDFPHLDGARTHIEAIMQAVAG